jgi:hypothetical protein
VPDYGFCGFDEHLFDGVAVGVVGDDGVAGVCEADEGVDSVAGVGGGAVAGVLEEDDKIGGMGGSVVFSAFDHGCEGGAVEEGEVVLELGDLVSLFDFAVGAAGLKGGILLVGRGFFVLVVA